MNAYINVITAVMKGIIKKGEPNLEGLESLEGSFNGIPFEISSYSREIDLHGKCVNVKDRKPKLICWILTLSEVANVIRNNIKWEFMVIMNNKAMFSIIIVGNSTGFDTFDEAYFSKDSSYLIIYVRQKIMQIKIAKKLE
jgi:hypothetical protein